MPVIARPAGERWGSQAGFLAAAIGSAVGLGNIWRFPFMVGQNGGGAFIMAYMAAVILLGLPLLIFEMTAGRRYRQGIVGTLRAIDPRLGFAGIGIAIVGLGIVSYYLVVTGWTLGYLVDTSAGDAKDFSDFTASWIPLAFFGAAVSLTLAIVLLGVRRGIETLCKAVLPLLVVIVFALALYGLTLAGRNDALLFLFKPRFGELASAKVWTDAFGQAFFSLGVGMGVLITYGAYLDTKTDTPRMGVLITGFDKFIAFLAGLVIFPVIFTYGGSLGSGPDLALRTLPAIFDRIQGGQMVGMMFYLLLFLAALTSAVSLVEMVTAAVSDWLGLRRSTAVAVIAAPLIGLGLLSVLSYSPADLRLFGEPVLDRFDRAFGTYGLLATALVTSVALFWLGEPRRLLDESGRGRTRAVRVAYLSGKYLVPAALVATLIATIVT